TADTHGLHDTAYHSNTRLFTSILLVTRLGDAIATGTRDQAFDALVEELTSQFARSQQLLNSISGTLSSKSVTG
uniref:Uncharacterized protein n=1 Tax=Aegilops tauschii subsp. strangulata TaxID=200361 RepID=A0A453DXM9_AEGTS